MSRARWGIVAVCMLWWLACTSDTTGFGTGGNSAGCPEGLSDCGGECVNLAQNPSHCGGCGESCEDGQLCSEGSCVSPCEAGEIQCDGACVDPANDARHCGGCGRACDEYAECTSYQCHCTGGRMDCSGECVYLMSDHEHCGECDEPCSSTEVCSSGVCESLCAPDETECGGSCVDLDTSMEHCGDCDQPCDPGTEICATGVCGCVGATCGACDFVDIGSTVPQTLNGNTDGALEELNSWCAAGGPDDVYRFTAPATNTYELDTEGTYATHVLSVRSEACAPIECVLAYDPVTIPVDLTAGESVLIAMEGHNGATLPYVLNLRAWPSCPETALGSQVPQTVAGTTLGGVSSQSLSCGMVDGKDHTYSFTAPTTGDYLFVLEGAFEPALEVRAGNCNGPVLGCGSYPGQLNVAVNVSLAQGQPVVILADSGWIPEAYTLYVDHAPPCPEHDLGSTVPQVMPATLIGKTHLYEPDPDCIHPGLAQTTFGFTAPATGTYLFDASLIDPIIEVKDGDCLGATIGCMAMPPVPTPLAVPLSQGQTVVVIISTMGPPQDFDFVVSPGPACPSDDLGSVYPQTVAGNTAGLLSLMHPSCTLDPSPDYSYAFTAPVAGAYTFETDTLFFDAALHVRDGDCTGAELACDDSSGVGTNALVTVDLAQSQTVVVTVDGANALESGFFQLDLTGP